MTKWYKLFIVMLCASIFSGCDNEVPTDLDLLGETEEEQKPIMEVTDYEFSPDYSHIIVNVRQNNNLGPYIVTDSTKVRIKTSLSREGLFGVYYRHFPKLEEISPTGSKTIQSAGLKMLVLVDFTLPEHYIEEQYNAVMDMRNFFPLENLYVAFMYKDGVTECMKTTDYMMEKSFNEIKGGKKKLLRSVLTKYEELTDSTGIFADAKYKAMLVFSDNDIYQGDVPIDPHHFELQEKLLNLVGKQDRHISLNYIRLIKNNDDGDFQAGNIMKLLCRQGHGRYAEQFNWPDIKDELSKQFNLVIPDFKFVLANQEHQVFKGADNILEIDFWDTKADTLITKASTHIAAGSIFAPIIVHGDSNTMILFRGLMWVLLLLALVYISFQFVIPYVRYRWFLKKYVVPYTGQNMSFNNIPVSTSCYYCKTPFEEGDEIVVKCGHVMHKECWDENDQHCPEYGIQCKDGSHYYNSHNLFDPKNASYYLLWISFSIIAGMLAWIVFTFFDASFSVTPLEQFYRLVHDDSDVDTHIQQFGSYFRLPAFGLWISFFTTLLLSTLATYRRKGIYFYAECLMRAIMAAIGGSLAFSLASVTVILFNLVESSILLSWIPWPLAGCVIAFCITYRTHIKFQKWWIIAALLLGVLSMLLWSVLFVDAMADFREIILLSHIIYSVGLGACIAAVMPRSHRYFLRLNEGGKGIDIALYKWLDANAEMSVKIGKSVDCQLQMSWDYNSGVMPEHAEIKFYHDRLHLFALEDGVVANGKPVVVGKPVPLFHGTYFEIANTSFVYIEKDI